ncbi:phospholipase [Bacillus sp. V3B]|uniref:phospholipase n=1 Tax=Bacillus sp. V3B TaxID=2804915 RepID=UPI00210C2130|nr:phospholipase [Bacillus sp. V3B]MCQ6277481.1 phospholipase [Bacillus sp. V3B]
MRGRRDGRVGFCIFPGYNWCGPGCSGPGAPMNEVDASCKAHDECYRRYVSRCQCDLEFLHRLRLQANPYTEQGRKATLMYKYMRIQSFFTCGF